MYTNQSWIVLGKGQQDEHKVAYINARVIDPKSGSDFLGGLLTCGKFITDFGPDIFSAGVPQEVDEVVDCQGLLLIPGIIDIHVHFREPGHEHKETIETGSKSAVAGGITTVVCQPNTSPPIDSVIIAKYIKYRAMESSHANIEFYASITKSGNSLTEMALLREAGAVGFTDDGLPVMNAMLMKQALSYSSMLNVPIAQHAEELTLSNGGCVNEGAVSFELGVKGIPDISESIIVNRDISLMKNIPHAHYHVLHISTNDSLEAVVTARKKGMKVTCEVAPHHFTLNENDVKKHGSFAKMNPPLRTEADRLSMIAGLQNGTIDCIATDHAPHDEGVKTLPIGEAAFGIVGLETMLTLSLELYHNGQMSLIDVLKKLTCNPADIINVPRGRIERGLVADLTLIDLNHEWVIQTEKFASKSKNSPFDGRKVKGRAVLTVVSGKTVYRAV